MSRETPSTEVSNELLAILRTRLSTESIARAESFLTWMGFIVPCSAPIAVATQVRSALVRAIDRLPDDLYEPTRLMCGLSKTTSSPRTTRAQIHREMAKVLPRQSRKTLSYSVPLTPRRVLTLEEQVLLPAMLEALQALDTDSEVYDSVVVRLTLRAGSSDKELNLTIEFTADVALDRWLVGITDDELAADYICALTQQVNEMLCPGPLSDDKPLPKMQVSVRPLRMKMHRPMVVDLVPLDPLEVAQLTEQPELGHIERVYWFSGNIPRDSPGEVVRLTFVQEQTIAYAARYCYWSASRRMYLRSLIVDASMFPNLRTHRLSLQPFLGVPASIGGREEEGIYDLTIDAFVDSGNGVAFIWGDGTE